MPEVISSGFVNNPVDSYHPRIDASRYVGHHVIKVDLNGANPENVSWRFGGGSQSDIIKIGSVEILQG
jgi:hypothetical protein